MEPVEPTTRKLSGDASEIMQEEQKSFAIKESEIMHQIHGDFQGQTTETLNTAYGPLNTNVRNTISIEIPESIKHNKGKSQLNLLGREESKFKTKVRPIHPYRMKSPDSNTFGPDEISMSSEIQFSNLQQVSPDNHIFKTKHHIKLKNILEKT